MSDLQDAKLLSPRLALFVTSADDQHDLLSIFGALNVPVCYQYLGKGTAPSEIMDIFGLSGLTRLVTVGVLPKFMVGELFDKVTKKMSIHHRGGGIALTVPVTGLQTPMIRALCDEVKEAWDERGEERMKENMSGENKEAGYSMIWVSVKSGFSDEVIDAAREAGAKGGTVLKGRRRSSEKASQNFGIPLQDEQDFVMIVIPKDKKARVMEAISAACGLRSEAHGVILALPVEEIMGLEE